MKKIAIPTDNGRVAAHFGHCAQFTLVDVVERRMDKISVIDNPGHRPGFLPRFLAEQGVNVLVAGGIGANAVNIFEEHDIIVCMGQEGHVNDVVERYLQGKLRSSGNACPEHS